MSQLNLNNIISKTNDQNVLNNCAMLHYQFLTIQSNNVRLNQTMKRIQSDDDKLKSANLELEGSKD